jgi:Pectate lyase superfamily protein
MANKFFRRRFLQVSSFFAAGAVSASTNASVNQPIKGAVNIFYSFSQRPKAGGVYLFARTGNYHIWDGKRWIVSGSVANVLDYGAVGDGVTDDTVAITNLIAAILARPQIQWLPIYFPSGKYIVSNSLRPVTSGNGGYGLDILGQGQESTIIEANIDKPVINLAGAGGPNFDYRQPGSIKNITIVNRSAGNSASVINASYTGRLVLDSVTIRCNHVGIKGGEVISASFDKVSIYPEDNSLNAGRFKKGFECFARNSNWRSCVIAGADICFDMAGDSNSFYGVDCEYSKVIFKLGAFSSLNIIGCHFETSDILLTNASVIPFSKSDNIPWVDNNTSGGGSLGSLNLIGCVCFFTRKSTNVMVLKSSATFVFTLNITGCTFTGENSLLCGSFTPNKLVSIPAGTRISITNTPNLRCAKPPSDNYSNFSKIGSSSQDEFDDVNVKQLSLGASHKPVSIPSSTLPTKRIPIIIDGTTYYLLAE